eukprot:CAMPEP_0195508828 /NCGR_PEP_ID=MMETSP0794_2-20130614/1933_1 /TAXON_ID=515487 /ORGANISM="Stephanopyxis turris, Strain CCMP 815" /LENGTH=274 /DNA_ID=CAMNT_0040635895 /DNA_START=290 /DNA_END=1114 /DNA_ORIENTATION=-
MNGVFTERLVCNTRESHLGNASCSSMGEKRETLDHLQGQLAENHYEGEQQKERLERRQAQLVEHNIQGSVSPRMQPKQLNRWDRQLEKMMLYGVQQQIADSEIAATKQVVEETLEYMETLKLSVSSNSRAKDSKVAMYQCRNENKFCVAWAARGECIRNTVWMILTCSPSCKTCDLLKKKQVDSAELQARSSRFGVRQIIDDRSPFDTIRALEETITYMENFSHATGGKTVQGGDAQCRNQHEKCAFWSSLGECDKNPWMIKNCSPSCKMCKKL